MRDPDSLKQKEVDIEKEAEKQTDMISTSLLEQ